MHNTSSTYNTGIILKFFGYLGTDLGIILITTVAFPRLCHMGLYECKQEK
jgi:hypothetical protein